LPNRLSNRFDNRFDNRVERTATVRSTRLSNPVWQPCWQPVVYTIQPVVKRVWQPVECLYTRYNRLLNRLHHRLDNRLYRVNGLKRFGLPVNKQERTGRPYVYDTLTKMQTSHVQHIPLHGIINFYIATLDVYHMIKPNCRKKCELPLL